MMNVNNINITHLTPSFFYLVTIKIYLDDKNFIEFELDNEPSLTIENISDSLSLLLDNGSNNNKKKIFLTTFDDNKKILFPNLKIIQRIISNPKKYKTLKVYQNNKLSSFSNAYSNFNPSSSTSFKETNEAYKRILYPEKTKSKPQLSDDQYEVKNSQKIENPNIDISKYERKIQKDYSNYSNNYSDNEFSPSKRVDKSDISDNKSNNINTNVNTNIIHEYKSSYSPYSSSSNLNKNYLLQNSQNKEEINSYLKKGYGTGYMPIQSGEKDSNDFSSFTNNKTSTNISNNNYIPVLSPTTQHSTNDYKKFSSEKRTYRPAQISQTTNDNKFSDKYSEYIPNKKTNEISSPNLRKMEVNYNNDISNDYNYKISNDDAISFTKNSYDLKSKVNSMRSQMGNFGTDKLENRNYRLGLTDNSFNQPTSQYPKTGGENKKRLLDLDKPLRSDFY